MATHNVMYDTGGLDASIRFAEEQARPENGGDGFSSTLNVLIDMADRYISATHSVVFNTRHYPTEFNDTTDTLSVAHFDSTFVIFDNNVAAEYISGTTQNPLVVGLNDTTNSSTYAELLARMLDTVPRGVQLTEVITPLPVKPSGLELIFDCDMPQFSGELWNMTLDQTHIVNMLWDDHVGDTKNVSLPPSGVHLHRGPPSRGVVSFSTENCTVLSLDAEVGIRTMRFVVDGKLEDQGDIGFAVQDGLLLSTSSCLTSKQFTNPFVG
ncbi:hypothetical protein DFH09DRAFT_1318014 [Mycena vulgaris]|nr:hypothetical protein DFH09DRAFT_1318014 [Mycena vulgaris]